MYALNVFDGKLFLNEMFKYSSSLLHVAEKYLKDNNNNSLYLALKICSDNARGQISEHIFAPNGGYCLYIG